MGPIYIVSDVEYSLKVQFLDRKFSSLLENVIMRGEDVHAKIAKVEISLTNINQTLLGNLSGDFSANEKLILLILNITEVTCTIRYRILYRTMQKKRYKKCFTI